ncbi:putative transmembrane anti-sigma factor [Anaeromyxobacter dehalogenans 2CP-1]|uniref:Transmembrane anti-sigma factor n=2 Tax=Anaeromyxobacteraceae TaxID=1524215 RepID=B8JCM4_ANAD2|nr:putative transmembrane anti-sigma factor [Anaeromyxobacter dehalogenans 2CP-1]
MRRATSDCVRYAPMIGAREGELSTEEARALAAHLEACDACGARALDLAATEGLVSEALLARAAERDFAPFVDQVMARIGHEAPAPRGVLSWLRRHWRGTAAALTPAVAAVAVFLYVRWEGSQPGEMALLEFSSEGNISTVIQTSDGPVVLLDDDDEGSGS